MIIQYKKRKVPGVNVFWTTRVRVSATVLYTTGDGKGHKGYNHFQPPCLPPVPVSNLAFPSQCEELLLQTPDESILIYEDEESLPPYL